jgi:hypothetical protein
MDFPKDRRTLLLLGGGVAALAAGVGIAVLLMSPHRGETSAAPPASQAGLVIDATSSGDDNRMDPARPLRCFVAGQLVGELTLADCANRNGVATGALDVGVDETGALAAADQGGVLLTPLPPATETSAPPASAPAVGPETAPQAATAPAGACWRYADGQWRRLPVDQTLNACIQTLFAGRCERPGGATYGRWLQLTLRLVPGRVELSNDNHSFRPVAEQGPGCAIPPLG